MYCMKYVLVHTQDTTRQETAQITRGEEQYIHTYRRIHIHTLRLESEPNSNQIGVEALRCLNTPYVCRMYAVHRTNVQGKKDVNCSEDLWVADHSARQGGQWVVVLAAIRAPCQSSLHGFFAVVAAAAAVGHVYVHVYMCTCV